MRSALGRRVGLVASACALFAFAACATILDFPDRVLDTGDGAVDGPTVDTGGDTNPPVDAGPQRAELSADVVDFGIMPCGADAGTSHVITLRNVGGQPLSWIATLSATMDFAIDGPIAGTIPALSSADITITSTPVSPLAGAGDTAQATLILVTNDPDHPQSMLAVQRTAGGATLNVVPLTAAFGDTPPTVAATDVPIAIQNVGNQPVSLAFGPSSDSQFSLTCSGAACPMAGTAIAADASFPTLVAHFTPTDAGDYQATSTINATGALCGTNPTVLTFTGKGAGSYASVQPGSLDFGMVDCGTAAAPKTFKILHTNPLAPSFNWTLVTAPTNYTLTVGGTPIGSGQGGSVSPGGTTVVTVVPNAIPSTSSIAPNAYGETLTITTDAANDTDPHTVALLMTAHGAILSQSASTVAFGSVLVSGPAATFPLTVSNTGNASATVSYAVTDPAFAVAPQNQTVAGGSSYPATISFDPTAGTMYNATATMTVPAGTVLCQSLPTAIALSGQGALSASLTSSVDFGLVNCGSTAPSQNATLTNTSAAPFSWTAALANGTAHYTISPASGNNLMPGKSATITITPKAIPGTSATTADLYADTLSITTSPTLESPYNCSIHETAQGVILSFSPTSIDFGRVRAGSHSTAPFSVVNAGNAAANVSLATGTGIFTVQTSPITVAGSSSTNDNVTFNVPGGAFSGQNFNGSITPSTSSVKCAPLPPPLTLTGQAR